MDALTIVWLEPAHGCVLPTAAPLYIGVCSTNCTLCAWAGLADVVNVVEACTVSGDTALSLLQLTGLPTGCHAGSIKITPKCSHAAYKIVYTHAVHVCVCVSSKLRQLHVCAEHVHVLTRVTSNDATPCTPSREGETPSFLPPLPSGHCLLRCLPQRGMTVLHHSLLHEGGGGGGVSVSDG